MPETIKLLNLIIDEFIKYANKNNFIPVLVWFVQKDDILFIRKKYHFYEEFIKDINKKILTIRIVDYFINAPSLDLLYTDDTDQGGHYSSQGNKMIANILFNTSKIKVERYCELVLLI